MAQVSELFRHPIKAHGCEALTHVTLAAGKTFPWDRVWAVAHEAARIDPAGANWAACANFSRAAKAPALMAIRARLDEAANVVHLSHPQLGAVSGNPDLAADAAKLIAWAKPLMPEGRAQSAFIAKAADRGMTDTPYPSISINSRDTLAALSAAAGAELSPLRFRANIWVEGLVPWQEFDWVGRELRIGDARLTVRERIGRCLATAANPDTGERDLDTLGLLKQACGAQDFGVYAEVVTGGDIRTGDRIEIL
jgi:uncharacterized protein YcbX